MAIASAPSALDDEFQGLLARGGEAAARGELEPAREALEDALALRSRDPKALGLLGQVFYRLGRYDDAMVAWQRLVDDNPAEPGARVNLGLACLKARQYPAAIKQLKIALDLNPEHRKAAGYLGLAWLEVGEPARAREWFERAGSDPMVARCDELLAAAEEPAPLDRTARVVLDDLSEEPAAAPLLAPESAPEVAAEPASEPIAEAIAEAIAEVASEQAPEPVAQAPVEPPPEAVYAAAAEPAPETAPEPVPEPMSGSMAEPLPDGAPESVQDLVAGFEAPAPAPAAAPGSPVVSQAGPAPTQTLAGFASVRSVQGPAGQVFVAEGATLTVNVHGELLCRLAGLAAWRGELAFAGEVKRFRGRATDKPFGEPPEQMHRLVGDGLVVLRVAGRRFTVIELAGETGYFREAVVFGFQEQVAFENGRLPSPSGGLDLVHLRGHGRLVLVTRGEPVAVEVTGASPVHVPLSSLVGWTGALTPRIAPLFAGGAEAEAVEISGEGRVLVDPGPAARLGEGP